MRRVGSVVLCEWLPCCAVCGGRWEVRLSAAGVLPMCVRGDVLRAVYESRCSKREELSFETHSCPSHIRSSRPAALH